MSSPTFTVPSTATYRDRVTGVGYHLAAGDVITLRRAWLLQVPGATEPAADTSVAVRLGDLSDVTITDPQEGDVLVYVADWENG